MRKYLSALLLSTHLIGLEPSPIPNYCPVVIVNHTGLSADNIYFLAHGNDPNGIPSFLVPDSLTGKISFSHPIPNGSISSVSVSKALSSLPSATGTPFSNSYLIYMPLNSSSRGYFSINNKLFLATAINPALNVFGINDPSVTSFTDPNFYTLYQDFEFGLVNTSKNVNLTTGVYLNLSWVDYFCLPMQLYSYSYPSNDLIALNPQSIPAGTIPGLSRQTLLNTLQTALKASNNSSWSSLGVPYYTNPYIASTPLTWIRILAAKNSIALGGSSVQFNYPGTSSMFQYFDPNYCTNASMGPSTNTSYMQAVYNYYKTASNPLYTQIVPGNYDGPTQPVYEVTASATDLTLNFNCVNPSSGSYQGPNYTLLLGNSDPVTGEVTNGGLTTQSLLGGNATDFNFVVNGGGNNGGAFTAELAKLVSALFSIGYFPFPNPTGSSISGACSGLIKDPPNCVQGSSSCPFPNISCGYNYLTYFQTPPFSGKVNGIWYNLYSKILHTQMISSSSHPVCFTGCNPPCGYPTCTLCSNGCVPSNPSLGVGYAYDYDDLLNMSGLINGLTTQDQYANPPTTSNGFADQIQPYIVIVLDAIDSSSIPNLNTQTTPYQVSVASAPNGATVSFSWYASSDSETPQTITASTTKNSDLGPVFVSDTKPFKMTYNFTGPTPETSYTATFNLNLQYQTAIPDQERFNGTDQSYQSSIQFSVEEKKSTPGNPHFLIQYDSSTPTWP